MHKPNKLLLSLALFIILLAGLLFATSPNYAQQEQPYPVEVFFKEDITLPQASQLLTTLNITNTASQWTWQITYQNHDDLWNGGFSYTPGTQAQPLNNQIWQQYVGLVNSVKTSVGSKIKKDQQNVAPIPPNRQRQYDANADEMAWLEANIIGCWDTNTCPAFTVIRVTIMATADTIRQLQASPLVRSTEPVIPPPAFFLLKFLGMIN